jgi:hypothetical protein
MRTWRGCKQAAAFVSASGAQTRFVKGGSDMIESEATATGRRGFLTRLALGSAALTSAGSALLGNFESSGIGVSRAGAEAARYKMAFIQWQPHTVPAAWSKGIEEVLKPQQVDEMA